MQPKQPKNSKLAGNVSRTASSTFRSSLGSAGQGRIYLMAVSPTAGTLNITSAAYATQQAGWVWWAISGVQIPEDATSVRVGLYHDTSGSPSVLPVYFDQAALALGLLPRAL